MENVCAGCIGDDDLKAWIYSIGGRTGCDFCRGVDFPTCKLAVLCDRIHDFLIRYWGTAVEQLPYESAEGGYQGATWDTEDILFDHVDLQLPRDETDVLRFAIVSLMEDEVWCDFDWGTLEYDQALWTSWERFCTTVMHSRRFFFHVSGTDERDSYTPVSLLRMIARISEQMNILNVLPTGTELWRARPGLSPSSTVSASDFGPPPETVALQSNRMNPPGIPMLYLASTAKAALIEARAKRALVGHWLNLRALKILDLRALPSVPGFFSNSRKSHRQALLFLHWFTKDIMKPVERDQKNHIEYLPSQVVTEFFRDFEFKAGRIDGIAYGSTLCPDAWNIVLFADRSDVGVGKPEWPRESEPWLHFSGAAVHVRR